LNKHGLFTALAGGANKEQDMPDCWWRKWSVS